LKASEIDKQVDKTLNIENPSLVSHISMIIGRE